MTELSPLGTVNTLKAQHLSLDADAQANLAAKQGGPPFGIDLKTVDDVGRELPRDGATTGDLLVRGHWVVDRYFRHDNDPRSEEHTSELQSLMRISYAVFCLKKKKTQA